MAEWTLEGFSPLARAMAVFLERLNEAPSPLLGLSTALVVAAMEQGHTCLDLRAVGGRLLGQALGNDCPQGREEERLPETAAWVGLLGGPGHPVVGKPGARAPLILDDAGRLYLHRYWTHEQAVARGIQGRVAPVIPDGELGTIREIIERLFGDARDEPDWQRVAAAIAARHGIAVVSGGPGTGKTYTLVRILALVVELGLRTGRAPLVALAAPTGKAASRLAEAVREARQGLGCAPEVDALIPAEASTLHRLLGSVRHGREDGVLPHDLVVVDECSMADVSLMALLFSVLRPEARLVLAGDKDQLSSVEAGVVMGDICDTGREHGYGEEVAAAIAGAAGQAIPASLRREGEPAVSSCIAVLRRNYRMPDTSGIARLARAINSGDAESALDILENGAQGEVRLEPYGGSRELYGSICGGAKEWFLDYTSAPSAEELFEAYARRVVLCALRRGPAGVDGINAAVSASLRRSGLVPAGPGGLFPGLPVIVSVNDYSQRLFNGDIGIVAPRSLRAAGDLPLCLFPGVEGGYRAISPARLPPHEGAFALTVHKSQGSEFDEVTLVLPPSPSPVLCRELLYTAVTRARRRVTVLGSAEVVRWAVEHPTARSSGLRDQLWLS